MQAVNKIANIPLLLFALGTQHDSHILTLSISTQSRISFVLFPERDAKKSEALTFGVWIELLARLYSPSVM